MMMMSDLFRPLTIDDHTNIYFDEPTHKYTDNCGNVYKSVTTVIHDFVPPFDAQKHARIESTKTGESVTSILNKWKHINKSSTTKGTATHNELESHVKFTSKFSNAIKYIRTDDNRLRCFSIKDINLDNSIGVMSLSDFEERLNGKYPLIFRAISYYVSQGFRIYSEINVFNPLFLISGTIDILLVRGNEFVIIDWKTNRNDIPFKSGYYKKDKDGVVTSQWVDKKSYLLYPIDTLEDCNGVHYGLQLSEYALLVSLFGYTCKDLILFHIRDSYVLNKYGMPLKDPNGMYITDDTKDQVIKPYKIHNYDREIRKLITYYYNKNKPSINNQIFLEL